MPNICHWVNSSHWTTKENRQKMQIFSFFRSTQKIGPDGPKWGKEDFFLANPDLADILGRTDFDFENVYSLTRDPLKDP